MPILRPVFYREKKAQLYDTSPYFLGCFFAATFALIFYPCAVAFITFFTIGVADKSFGNFVKFVFVLIM